LKYPAAELRGFFHVSGSIFFHYARLTTLQRSEDSAGTARSKSRELQISSANFADGAD
jgi:hypothetical protein